MTTESIPVYSDAERARRWDLARSFMESQGLDALLVFGEHEDAGAAPFAFDNWFSNSRPGSTIIFSKIHSPIELVPYPLTMHDHFQSKRRGEAVWISTENIRLGRNSAAVSNVMEQLQLSKSTIGVVGLEVAPPWHVEGIIPYTLWSEVLKRFPEVTWKPVQDSFSQLIMALGDEEVAVLRKAAEIGEEMAKAMFQVARPGVSESEVYKAGMDVALSQGTTVPYMHLSSGPDTIAYGPPMWIFRPQAPRILQDGDMVLSEAFSFFGMKGTQHQLSIAIGDVDPVIYRCAEVARACYEAGLRALRPGVLFEEVCKEMLKPIEEAGAWVRGPQIHSLNPLAALCGTPKSATHKQIEGFEKYPEDDGMSALYADMEIKVGMSFAFEPSAGFGSRVVTLGGTVLVGEEEAIELNPFTSQLQRVTV